MKFHLIKLFCLIIIFYSEVIPQRLLKLTVEINDSQKVLSYITKAGNTFVSAKEFGSILNYNHFYNPESSKLELKFQDYVIKFTGKSQFVVITKKADNGKLIYQLPISTLSMHDDVFIPLNYSLEYLSKCCGKNIFYNNSSKKLKISDKEIDAPLVVSQKDPNDSADEKKLNVKKTTKTIDSRYDIYGLDIEEKSNGTMIRLKASKKINLPRYSINNNILYVFFTKVSFYRTGPNSVYHYFLAFPFR